MQPVQPMCSDLGPWTRAEAGQWTVVLVIPVHPQFSPPSSYLQRVFERLSEELASRGRGHLAGAVTAFNEDDWQDRRQIKVIWQQEEEP